MENRLSREEAARHLGLAPRTLAVWASDYWRKNNGKMPVPLYKIGGRVQYSKADLDEYIAKQRRE